MEHQPPPFFKTGPSPLTRLALAAFMALALMIADARFRYLDTLREIAAVIVYPLQRIATAPFHIAQHAREFFVTHASLREENARLARQNLANGALVQQLKSLQAENAQLRELMGARSRVDPRSVLAEIVYAARDPFSRKVVIDKGSRHAVKNGQPVIDEIGVIGQVTRVYPWVSEVTLITDKDHLVPVINERNGLRAVLAGTGRDSELELRFVPLSADFRTGDRLVTSGLDGVYPPGLNVAEISSVERNAASHFARIIGRPLAGVNRNTLVLVLSGERELPAPPPPAEEKPARAKKSRKAG
jgi:rod shape-determining protein MreC